MAGTSRVKDSGGKLVTRSDLREVTARDGLVRNVLTNYKNRDIRVGTWNVQGLGGLEGAWKVADEADRYGLEFIALQETKLAGEGQRTGEKYTLFYGGNCNSRHLGTGFLVKNNILTCIKNVKIVSDRISYVILQSMWYKYAIINVHCPTNGKDDEVKNIFYDELGRLYERLSCYDVTIIMGDFNAKIGREEFYRPVIGQESLHKFSNGNGVKVIDFAITTDLIIKSTYFKHKDIHKETWKSPDGRTFNQIDHVLIDKRHHTNILDVRTFRGADFNSDHFLVVAKLRDRLTTTMNKQDKRKKTNNFDIEKLKDRTSRIEYEIEISNRFQNLESLNTESEPENMWEEIKNAVELSAKKVIGQKKRKNTNKPWFDDECKEWLDKRREARLKYLNSNCREAIGIEYNRIRKEISTIFRNKKREWEKQRVLNIQEKFRTGNTREAYRGINAIRKGYQAKSDVIRGENGNLVTDANGVMNVWCKYFEKLLNVHNRQSESENTEIHAAEVDVNIAEPNISEVESAIRKLKNNKAPGIDQLPGELFKYGGEAMVEGIQKLIGSIWEHEKIPDEWKKLIMIPVFKKGDKTDCRNYRGIALLSTCYKIFSYTLLAKLRPYAEEILGDYQCGFRPNRSTSDQLHTVRQILEKKWEYQEAVHQLFVDFKKAYDSVKRSKMYEILLQLGIPKKLVRMIQICLIGVQGRVRVGNNLSEPFEIRDGLKQGDALSPLLFNLVLEFVIRRMQTSNEGINIDGVIQVLAYADDLDILGETREIIVKNAELLLDAAAEVGLYANEKKTEYMETDRKNRNNIDRQPLIVGNMTFNKVDHFKYLGANINNENNMGEELKKRLQAGNACYFAVSTLLKSRNLSRNVKIKIYKTIILPVVLYGCETWTLTKEQEDRFRVFENKILRRIFGAKVDEVTGDYRRLYNAELENLYGSPSIVRVIKSRRLRWAGHVARMGEDRAAFRVMTWKPQKTRGRGKPRLRWGDNIKRDLKEIGREQIEWVEHAKNRENWRMCVDEAMNFRVRNDRH